MFENEAFSEGEGIIDILLFESKEIQVLVIYGTFGLYKYDVNRNELL